MTGIRHLNQSLNTLICHHSLKHTGVFGICLHHGNTETRKTIILPTQHLIPTESKNGLFLFSTLQRSHRKCSSTTHYINTNKPQFLDSAFWRRANVTLETSALESLYGCQLFTFSYQLCWLTKHSKKNVILVIYFMLRVFFFFFFFFFFDI